MELRTLAKSLDAIRKNQSDVRKAEAKKFVEAMRKRTLADSKKSKRILVVKLATTLRELEEERVSSSITSRAQRKAADQSHSNSLSLPSIGNSGSRSGNGRRNESVLKNQNFEGRKLDCG